MTDFIVMGSALCLLLCFPISGYVAYTKLEEAERYLQFSTFVVTFKYRFRGGLFGGRLNRLFVIAIVILIPAVFQWRRLVLIEDVKHMPKTLRLWIVFPFLFTLFTILGMTVSWLLTR